MKINQLKVGVALSYLSMGLGYVVSILYTPIMLRLLGQSEYGLYNLVASIVAYMGVLNFGFGSAYMRYYSKYKAKNEVENIKKLNGMFLIIFSVLGLIALLAGIVLVLNTEMIFGARLSIQEISRARILMMVMVVNMAISFPGIVFNSHITANEKFVFQKLLQVLKTLVNPFLMLPILLLGYGSVGMVMVSLFISLSIELGNILYCLKKLKMSFRFENFDTRLFREMTVYSSFIFVNLVVDQVNWNVDKFILGRFFGTTSVAIYGLAAQLNVYFMSFSTAITNVFIPRVHKMVASTVNNDELTTLFTKVGRVQFALLFLIASGLIFFGKSFIQMWAGSNYADTYPIALILIIPSIVPLIQNIGIEISRAKNLHRFRSFVYFLIAILNIAISIPLAQQLKGIGAALGTAFALIVGNGFIMNWYYHKYVKIDIIYFWKNILSFIPSMIVPIFYGIFINTMVEIDSVFKLLLFGGVYVIIYGVSLWFFGLNSFEKDLVQKPINNRINMGKRKI